MGKKLSDRLIFCPRTKNGTLDFSRRSLNQLKREWDLAHEKFLTLNHRLKTLVSRFVYHRPNNKLALSIASEKRVNAQTRNGTTQH
jgi:hypothetical protein